MSLLLLYSGLDKDAVTVCYILGLESWLCISFERLLHSEALILLPALSVWATGDAAEVGGCGHSLDDGVLVPTLGV